MAMCLGPDGVVVHEVDQAVGVAVHRPTDGCLIKQMCTADLRCVSLLEDVLRCKTLEVADIIDGQWLYRCGLAQVNFLML